MLHVNEDTDDELFRKAAADYLLDADKPDWLNLLHKINTVPTEIATVPPVKKTRLAVFARRLIKKTKSDGAARWLSRLTDFFAWQLNRKKKVRSPANYQPAFYHFPFPAFMHVNNAART